MSSGENVADNDDGATVDSWFKMTDVQITTTPPNSILDSSMEECLLDALKENSSGSREKSRANSLSGDRSNTSVVNDQPTTITTNEFMENTDAIEIQQELMNMEWVWNWSSRPEVSSPISLSTWQNKMKHYKLVNKSTTSTSIQSIATNNNNDNNSNNDDNNDDDNIVATFNVYHSDVDSSRGLKQSNVDECFIFKEDVLGSDNNNNDNDYKEGGGGSSITFILITHACSFLIGVSLAFLYFRRYNETAGYSNI